MSNKKKSNKKSKNNKSASNPKYKFKWISISLIVAFLTGLFLYFAKEQVVSAFINHLLYGLFGRIAAIIPIVLICLSIYVSKTNSNEHIKSKYILSGVALWFLSVFAHLCSSSVTDPILAFREGYDTFSLTKGGGFFGALIAFPLSSAIGRGAVIAIVVIVEIILISLIINKSLFSVFAGMLRGTFGAITKEGEEIDHKNDYSTSKKKTHDRIRRIQNKGFDVVIDERTQQERGEDIIGVAKEFAGNGDKSPEKTSASRKSVSKKDNKKDSIFSEGLVESITDDGIDKVFNGLIDKSKKLDEVVSDASSQKDPSKAFPFGEGVSEADGRGSAKLTEEGVNETDGRETQDKPKREQSLTEEEAAEMSAEIEQNEDTPIREYIHPTLDLLKRPRDVNTDQRKAMYETSKQLIRILDDFGVRAKLLEVTQGPTVTRYEIQPDTGIKLAKIQNLAEDLAMNLAVPTVLVSPVPGKAAVGIEIPNREVISVSGREIFASDEFQNSKSKLTFALGKDIGGRVIVGDLGKMPHLLIAGATGSGKSVCVNTIITSILYNASPDEVKLIMIDPKVVELGVYNGIPHLLIPVVTDPKRAAGALNWAVSEMMHRYDLFATNSVRNIIGYNELMEKQNMRPMHKIVIIIDELADLMMVAAKEVEDYICRLTQLARAAGIHLIVATQRPSVDVVTGLIKANIPSRIAFAVSSQVDSRTIIDRAGAEKLLGKGDMLYYPASARTPMRVQGAFISDEEIENVIDFIKENNPIETHYSEDLQEHIDRVSTGENGVTNDKPETDEPLLAKAITMAAESGQISTSMIQRKLSVGYARAGRIIDQMEERGIVGPANGSKPRQVYISPQEAREMFQQSEEEE